MLEEDPYSRIKGVVRWYLSGFYKKPKGLKKPYNPILGETFRCYWKHPRTGSRTFYISEQVGGIKVYPIKYAHLGPLLLTWP